MDGSPRPRRHLLSNAARGSVHPEQVHGSVCPRGSHDPAGPNNPRDRRRRSQPSAFRTRMDFAACCMSPGIAPFVGTPPGSDGLPPGHALGPSARPCFALQALRRACAPAFCRPCPAAPGRSIRNPRSSRPGIVAATATRPTQRQRSRRAPCRSGMAAVNPKPALRSIVLGQKSDRC